MLFKIECIDPKNNSSVVNFVFDNETNEIFDEEGNLLEFSTDERFADIQAPLAKAKGLVPVYDVTHPITKKSKLIGKLRIQLGMACNYNCKYCLQAAFRSKQEKMPGEQDVDRFFEKFKASGIRLAPKGIVELWGGEPLVYWKTLRVLIPKIREVFGASIAIHMITNGSLLTCERVNFLNAHRVQISISHDGPGFGLRDDSDPLMDKQTKGVWLYLLKTSRQAGIPMRFVCVLSPANCDIAQIRVFFDKHFSREVGIDFEGAVSYTGAQNQGCTFDMQSARKLDASIFKAVVTEPGKWPTLDQKVADMLRRVIHHIPTSSVAGRCDEMNANTLTVDLNGNIGSCHNRPVSFWKIGHIENFTEISNGNLTHWSKRPACYGCLLISVCKGGCPHLTNEELHACCGNESVYHMAIFGAAWFLLTEKVIVGVEPI